MIVTPALIFGSVYSTDIGTAPLNDVTKNESTLTASFNDASSASTTLVLKSSYRDALLNKLSDNYGASYGTNNIENGRQEANKYLDIAGLADLEHGKISYDKFAKRAAGEFGLFPLRDAKVGGIGHHGETPLSKTAFDDLYTENLAPVPAAVPLDTTIAAVEKTDAKADMPLSVEMSNKAGVFSKLGVSPLLSFDWPTFSAPRDVTAAYDLKNSDITNAEICFDEPTFTTEMVGPVQYAASPITTQTPKGYAEEGIDYAAVLNINYSSYVNNNVSDPLPSRYMHNDAHEHLHRTFTVRANKGAHPANDYVAPVGTPCTPAMDGVVSYVQNSIYDKDGKETNAGRYAVTFNPNSFYAFSYMHLSKIGVKTYQKVTTNDQIGLTGQSGVRVQGAHLHFGSATPIIDSKTGDLKWIDVDFEKVKALPNVDDLDSRIELIEHSLEMFKGRTSRWATKHTIPQEAFVGERENLPVLHKGKVYSFNEFCTLDVKKKNRKKHAKTVNELKKKWGLTDDPMLNLIFHGESKYGFNTVFGNRQNWAAFKGKKGTKDAKEKAKNLTDMTLNELIGKQRNLVKAIRRYNLTLLNQGKEPLTVSSAAGAGQILYGVLEGQMEKLGLTGNEYFDEAMQTYIFSDLLYTDGGLEKYLNGQLSLTKLNAKINNLWRAIPDLKTGKTKNDEHAEHNNATVTTSDFRSAAKQLKKLKKWGLSPRYKAQKPEQNALGYDGSSLEFEFNF